MTFDKFYNELNATDLLMQKHPLKYQAVGAADYLIIIL
jgi:hypothetical protein